MSRQLLVLGTLSTGLLFGCSAEKSWIDASDAGGRSDAPADSTETSWEPVRHLVDNALWDAVPLHDDPFADMRRDNVPCPDTEWGLEDLGVSAGVSDGSADAISPAFEVHTQVCDYLTVEQPLLAPIRAGDRITALLWHTQLTKLEGEGYVALSLEGRTLWETTIALPEVSRSRPIGVVAERDVAQGASVRFHLHNHGQNTWNLADLIATTPE